MTTQIYTSSICDRCGTRQTQNGAHETIPWDWAYVELRYRNVTREFESKKELCQKCFFELSDWLRRQPETEATAI